MNTILRSVAVLFVSSLLVSACSTVPVSKEELIAKKEEAVQTLGNNSAIFWASVRPISSQMANLMAEQWNLKCDVWLTYFGRCYAFMARVAGDSRLRRALETARILGVVVNASSEFSYGNGWVVINTESSTEEILNYLLGK